MKQQQKDAYDKLRLKSQLCFPLYACSKEVIRHYKPLLDELDLTYTQYITMMVLWEKKSLCVNALGEELYLDSGTLTPLLKKLEKKGYLTRCRCDNDERSVKICITEEGEKLKEKAASIPEKMESCVKLSEEESAFLYRILYRMLEQLNPS